MFINSSSDTHLQKKEYNIICYFLFQFFLNPQEINRLERERNEEAQKIILTEIAKDKPVLNRTHSGSKSNEIK